jgi:hypothetical protein
MKCPVCQKHELVKQSLEDCGGEFPDIFCPEVVDIGNGKKLNHYREYAIMDRVRIIVLPFRILTDEDDGTFRSNIGILSKYKSGKPYFKTLLKLPEIHADTEEKLLNRIKTLLLFS